MAANETYLAFMMTLTCHVQQQNNMRRRLTRGAVKYACAGNPLAQPLVHKKCLAESAPNQPWVLTDVIKSTTDPQALSKQACYLQPFIQLICQACLEEPAEKGIALMSGSSSRLMRCEQPCHLICCRPSGAVLALIRLDTHMCIRTQPITQSLDATSPFNMGKNLASG